MAEPISNNYDVVIDGSRRTTDALSAPAPRNRPASGVDPRLTAAVDDAAAQNERGRDSVRDGAQKSGGYTRGLKELQEEGERKIRGVGGDGPRMPAMPTVPLSASLPTEQATPAPMAAPITAMATPAPAVTPPAGVAQIDPSILAALVAAVQQQSAIDAAAGITPSYNSEVYGSAPSSSSAVTPQRPQPLDVSQVSLERAPHGQLSQAQTAAVIDQALTINGVPNDPHLRAQWQQVYLHMAEGESSRNPNAVNVSDSNATGPRAADGAPSNSSRGLWQCIPSTFAAYHMAGTSNSIYDPVASAAASINYAMDRYHVEPTGEGLAAFAAARGIGRGTYTGY